MTFGRSLSRHDSTPTTSGSTRSRGRSSSASPTRWRRSSAKSGVHEGMVLVSAMHITAGGLRERLGGRPHQRLPGVAREARAGRPAVSSSPDRRRQRRRASQAHADGTPGDRADHERASSTSGRGSRCSTPNSTASGASASSSRSSASEERESLLRGVVVGLEPEYFTKGRRRFRRFSQPQVRDAEVSERLQVVRLEPDGLLEVRERIGDAFLRGERDAEVVVDFRQRRIESQRLGVLRERFVEPPEAGERQAEIGARAGVAAASAARRSPRCSAARSNWPSWP